LREELLVRAATCKNTLPLVDDIAAEQHVIKMNVQFLLRQHLQPYEERLFAFAFHSYKEPHPFFNGLPCHTSADVWHCPKFAGEIFSHQARLAAKPLDLSCAINARGFAARLFGKKHLLFFQLVENRWIVRRE